MALDEKDPLFGLYPTYVDEPIVTFNANRIFFKEDAEYRRIVAPLSNDMALELRGVQKDPVSGSLRPAKAHVRTPEGTRIPIRDIEIPIGTQFDVNRSIAPEEGSKHPYIQSKRLWEILGTATVVGLAGIEITRKVRRARNNSR